MDVSLMIRAAARCCCAPMPRPLVPQSAQPKCGTSSLSSPASLTPPWVDSAAARHEWDRGVRQGAARSHSGHSHAGSEGPIYPGNVISRQLQLNYQWPLGHLLLQRPHGLLRRSVSLVINQRGNDHESGVTMVCITMHRMDL